jgi:uncharacterized membrane protein
MHVVFALARLYPFWAVPFAIVVAQLGLFFRRKARASQWSCWAVSFFLMLGVALWIAFRGDLHSDEWVRAILS